MFAPTLSFHLSHPSVRPVGEGKERIMMFVSMVNSRFYVHVILLVELVKLPLQKLLLFLIIGAE